MISWAGLLVIKDRKVLMTKEKDKDFFMLPGGRIESEESHLQTILREIEEELGKHIKVKDIQYYNSYILPGKAENSNMEFHVYSGKISGKFILQNEIKEIRWINSIDVKNGEKIGNITSLKLFPELLEKGLID